MIFLTHGSHLPRLVKLDSERFGKIFFDSIDHPPEAKKLFQRYLAGRRPNGRPDLTTRFDILREMDAMTAYRSTYHSLWFLAPIWQRLALNRFDEFHRPLLDRAVNAIIQNTNTLFMAIFNDIAPSRILFMSLDFVKDNPKREYWIQGWIHAGALPSLLSGIVSLCDGITQ
jgi:hypothetical protein